MDNTAQFEALKQATLGANAISAPVSNLGASNAPELAQLYQSSFQLPQSSGATAAHAQLASDVVAEQKAAATRAAAEAKQKEADLSDPKKYRQVKKEDGGYDFFAPDGSQVDIATLTQRTGTKPVDWLSDSENPIDVQYLEDQKNLTDYIKAKLSKNEVKVKAYEDAQPDLAQYQGQGGAHDLIKKFQQTYQRYYVPRSQDQNAWGANPGNIPIVRSSAVDPYALAGGNGIGQ